MSAYSTPKKARARPNANVTCSDYRGVVARWVAGLDGTVQNNIGPLLCKAQKDVTAKHMVRVSTILVGFLDIGLENGVLIGVRLEAAIRQVVSDAMHKSEKGANPDVFAHDFAEHLRYCFNTLRFYKMEKICPPPRGSSKISVLLRHAQTAELVVLNGMAEKLKITEADLDDPSSALSLPSPSPSPPCSPREPCPLRSLSKVYEGFIRS